jgi:hypothetical protein
MSNRITALNGESLQTVTYDRETDQWIFKFGEYVLQIAAPWRLIARDVIYVGHGDDGHQFGLPKPVNAGDRVREIVQSRVVEEASASDRTADLSIDFGEGIRLEVFNNSCGYEGWILNAPDGRRALVGMGGGNLHEWKI